MRSLVLIITSMKAFMVPMKLSNIERFNPNWSIHVQSQIAAPVISAEVPVASVPVLEPIILEVDLIKESHNDKQYSTRMPGSTCLIAQYGECPNLQTCLLDELHIEPIFPYTDNENFIRAHYEVGCAKGYAPNMEGKKSTDMECTVDQQRGTLSWVFSNTFDCVPSSARGFSPSSREAPPCNLDGISWFQTENYVRADNTVSAVWPLLLDNTGAFMRTRIPMEQLVDSTGYENGFLIIIVYNLKLSDFQVDNIRFTMYSSDFKHITTAEDDESTVVIFKQSTQAQLTSFNDPLNIYFSIEGVNMDQTQHTNYQIGTLASLLYTEDSYVVDLGTCILPLIDSTPADG